jgi:hypothetical protein
MGLRVCEFGQFSPSDHAEISVQLVLDHFGNFVAGEVEVEKDVGERFLVVVGVDSNAIHNGQSVVHEQSCIKTSHALVSGHDHSRVHSWQAGLVTNHAVSEMVGASDVLVQNKRIFADSVVFFLNVMRHHLKNVAVPSVQFTQLF